MCVLYICSLYICSLYIFSLYMCSLYLVIRAQTLTPYTLNPKPCINLKLPDTIRVFIHLIHKYIHVCSVVFTQN